MMHLWCCYGSNLWSFLGWYVTKYAIFLFFSCHRFSKIAQSLCARVTILVLLSLNAVCVSVAGGGGGRPGGGYGGGGGGRPGYGGGYDPRGPPPPMPPSFDRGYNRGGGGYGDRDRGYGYSDRPSNGSAPLGERASISSARVRLRRRRPAGVRRQAAGDRRPAVSARPGSPQLSGRGGRRRRWLARATSAVRQWQVRGAPRCQYPPLRAPIEISAPSASAAGPPCMPPMRAVVRLAQSHSEYFSVSRCLLSQMFCTDLRCRRARLFSHIRMFRQTKIMLPPFSSLTPKSISRPH